MTLRELPIFAQDLRASLQQFCYAAEMDHSAIQRYDAQSSAWLGSPFLFDSAGGACLRTCAFRSRLALASYTIDDSRMAKRKDKGELQ